MQNREAAMARRPDAKKNFDPQITQISQILFSESVKFAQSVDQLYVGWAYSPTIGFKAVGEYAHPTFLSWRLGGSFVPVAYVQEIVASREGMSGLRHGYKNYSLRPLRLCGEKSPEVGR
jgi:hypothetical protein